MEQATNHALPLQNYRAMQNAQAEAFDPQAFSDNHRIHVEHGSLFNPSDPLLVVHPREMAESNMRNLVQKVVQTYLMDVPSFFSDSNRAPVALALAGLMPLSMEAEHAALADQVKHVVTKQQMGSDPELDKQEKREQSPFAAVIDQYLKEPEYSVAETEQASKAVSSYLIIEEALKNKGYKEPLFSFAQGVRDTEGLVSKLSNYLGVSASDFTNAARKGGVEGVANLLGVDNAYVQEVSRLTEALPEHKFSANAIQNWKIGREVLQQPLASTNEKMLAGIAPRVQMKIKKLQQHFGNQQDIPEQLQKSEQYVLGAIRMLPPELSEALYRVGAEFSFTPERTVHPIAPDIPAYGFHRRVTKRPDDVEGIYQIFVSGKHDTEEFKRVMVHEAHHLLFPTSFSAEDIEAVDQLASRDMDRLKLLNEKMEQWFNGDDAVKMQVRAELDTPEFAVRGVHFSQIVSESDMDNFHNQVSHAHDRLQIDSDFYHRSGYDTPESKFQEVNSRYAELKHVRLRGEQDMLAFMVPGQTTIYDHIYMPHVERTLDMLRARDAGVAQVATSEQGAANDDYYKAATATSIHQPHTVSGGAIAADAVEAGGLLDPLDAKHQSDKLLLSQVPKTTGLLPHAVSFAGRSPAVDSSIIL